MALISALDETSSLFTGTGKISTLGNLHRGESLVSDVSALFAMEAALYVMMCYQ